MYEYDDLKRMHYKYNLFFVVHRDMRDPSGQRRPCGCWCGHSQTLSRRCLVESQPVFRIVNSSVVDSWSSSSVANSGGGLDMVRVGHHGGSNGLPHDGLSLHGNGDGDVVGSINMDGGGDLDDLLGVEGGVKRSIVRLVDEDGVLDLVDLLHGLDNWGVDSLGSPEDSWDSDGKMRGGWLDDPGGEAGHVVGLTEVDLLGDDRGRLVDGGDSLCLMDGGVRSRGGGSNVVDWVRHDGSGRVMLWTIGGHGSRAGSSVSHGSGSGNQGGGGG